MRNRPPDPGNPPPSTDIQTVPPLVGFLTKNVPPSQYVYLQDNDLLLFQTFNWPATGTTLTARYRYLTPQGEIKEGTWVMTSPTPITQFTQRTGECWLLSIAMQASGVFAINQWMFVQLIISRGLPNVANPLAYGMIWEGYISGLTANGWPGSPAQRITDGAGMLRSITGTVPAVGADISETVPATHRWNLIAFRAQLTASAAVGNRMIGLQIDDGVNILTIAGGTHTQTANAVAVYSTSQNFSGVGQVTGDNPLLLNVPFPLKGTFRIRTATAGLLAGDQWTAPQYLVQEWGAWDA